MSHEQVTQTRDPVTGRFVKSKKKTKKEAVCFPWPFFLIMCAVITLCTAAILLALFSVYLDLRNMTMTVEILPAPVEAAAKPQAEDQVTGSIIVEKPLFEVKEKPRPVVRVFRGSDVSEE